MKQVTRLLLATSLLPSLARCFCFRSSSDIVLWYNNGSRHIDLKMTAESLSRLQFLRALNRTSYIGRYPKDAVKTLYRLNGLDFRLSCAFSWKSNISNLNALSAAFFSGYYWSLWKLYHKCRSLLLICLKLSITYFGVRHCKSHILFSIIYFIYQFCVCILHFFCGIVGILDFFIGNVRRLFGKTYSYRHIRAKKLDFAK